MKLQVLRYSSQIDCTNGLLFDITHECPRFLCYTLEDEMREEKIYSETRIPAGTYNIKLRNVGRLHEKYKTRFKGIHKGTLHLQAVPNFKYILIHCGNTDEHTAGCLLLGDTQTNNIVEKNGYIGKSTQAYQRVYPPIAEEIEKGKEVTIEYINLD